MSAQKRTSIKRKDAALIRGTDAYENFLKRLRLVGLGLQHCSAKLDRPFYAGLEKGETIKEVAAQYELANTGEDYFNALAHFELCVRVKSRRKNALSIDCGYLVHFHFDGNVSKDHISQFVESELRLVVWPYFRQFVSDLTARMSIPSLLVPLSEPE